MNDELSKAMVDILHATKEGVVNVGIIIQQQAPELAKQIINYSILSDSIFILLFLTILSLYFVFIPKVIKASEDDVYSGWPTGYFVFGGIAALGLSILIIYMINDIVMALTAPKLFIIKYIKLFIS